MDVLEFVVTVELITMKLGVVVEESLENIGCLLLFF